MGNACSFTGPPPTETPAPICNSFGLLSLADGPTTTERPRTVESKGLSGWRRPHGQLHKMTLAVRDPAESVAFCEKYLGCQEIAVTDATLCARGIKWVRLGKNQGDGELHFVGCGRDKSLALRGGIDLDDDGVVSKEEMGPITEATIQEWVDAADDDMRAWTVFCNTHCAWSVADLTPIVAALEVESKPFFGPVRRADGIFQLYVELPYHHYLEIDSLTFNGTVGTPSAQAWVDVV